MIYLSIEISKSELYNAEFCNLKIDFLILQIIHQDVCWDDGTGSDGRRILWLTVSQKTFVFLIKQLVKVSPLILFSELFFISNIQSARCHTSRRSSSSLVLIDFCFMCGKGNTAHIFLFLFCICTVPKTREKK